MEDVGPDASDGPPPGDATSHGGEDGEREGQAEAAVEDDEDGDHEDDVFHGDGSQLWGLGVSAQTHLT